LEALAAIADRLRRRRGALLQAWRDAVRVDPALTTSDSMPRVELNDHIPEILSAFETALVERARDGIGATGAPAQPEPPAANPAAGAAAHGLHRWQQGYDLREVTRELGKLNECMVAELDALGGAAGGVDPHAMAVARLIWARLCTEGVTESAAQYFRLQQTEAAGHVGDLERALQDIRALERRRAELWQQAAHDLRGNLGIVTNATAGLAMRRVTDSGRDELLMLLQRNLASLHRLLDDVTSLARLQAGAERRHIASLDVATLMAELCEGLAPLAQQRGLYLRWRGTEPYRVDGDGVKLRRLAQNLILNAVKYTQQGGVDVAWGDSDDDDGNRWLLVVADTGPGFHAGPGAPLAGAIEQATQLSHGSDASVTEDAGHGATMPAPATDERRVRQSAGEGIGLSIVKRLCELLDATVELDSGEDRGTTFRILLPRRYGATGR
jgi:signal transduction histidine kinase